MRLAILTSNQLRHRHFIARLCRDFDVAGALIEAKKRDYSKKGEGTPLEEKVKGYFTDRDASEAEFYGNIEWPSLKEKIGEVIEVEAGTINDERNVAALKRWNPDHIAVFGSSILKEGIIDAFPGRIINMHLGLSPYYRGSGTNFWPLYDELPEYVGVTIHYLDKGIDSGKIIVQGRPDIKKGDTPHSIGNKTIVKGADLMVETLHRFERGEPVPAVEQDIKEGKLCLFKDCLPENILELEEKFRNGLIERYLERISEKTYVAPKIVQFIP